MARLANKVAIITGAARGMGAATAQLFINEGAKVVLADILDEAGEATAAALGANARFRHADVSKPRDWQALLATAESEFGHVNVLINNAAILFAASIADTSAEDFLRVVSINQLGCFLGIQAVTESMKAAGGGSIVNVSSIDGLQSKNGLTAYSSSKWAVRGLTKSAAIELGIHGIRVNSVHPGGIFTAMHGAANADALPTEADNAFYSDKAIPRVGMPVEVANMNVYLASDESSYSSGAEFIVDGGWSAGQRTPMLPGGA